MGGGGGSTSTSGDRRTDSGWITSTTLAQAAGIAIATLNTVASIQIASKQEQIARGYLQMAQQLRDYWMSVFVPCEAALVAEVCAVPPYEPQYDLIEGRFVASVRQQFAKAQDRLACINRYCVGLTAAMAKDLAIAEGLAAGDAANLGYRQEERRKDAMDDRRFSRKVTAVSLGRNLPSQALSYAQAAGNMYGQLGSKVGGGLGDLFQTLGYVAGRNNTEMPQNSGYNNISPNTASDTTATNTANIPLPPARPPDLGTTILGGSPYPNSTNVADTSNTNSNLADIYNVGQNANNSGTA